MLIGVVVHPINTLAHPTVPPGFRWAVHVGESWSDLSTCLQAGWEPDQAGAALAGENAAVVGVKVANLCGQHAELKTTLLEFDPIGVGKDFVTVGVG